MTHQEAKAMSSKPKGRESKKETYFCDVCGEEVDKVYECKECGTMFCADCGNPKKMLCSFCLEEEEEPL